MATVTKAVQTPMSNHRERETTISARVIKSIAVSMSYAEMDSLVRTFGRSYDELTTNERIVQAEFTAAVQEIRF